MSAIAQAIQDAVYTSPLAEAGTYADASGATTAVRVLVQRDADTLLGGSDIGVRGDRVMLMIRQAELAGRPAVGDSITIGATCYRVDEVSAREAREWVLYVVA